MGKKNAEAYGRRNSGEGAVLVRIKPTRIIAEKDIASIVNLKTISKNTLMKDCQKSMKNV